MFWPTKWRSVPLEDLGWVNTAYLASTTSKGDPTIVWGTSIRTEAMSQFVADQRRQTGAMVSATHVLIRAVAQAVTRHPQLNRRIVGRRVYAYKGVNVTMPMLETRSGEVNVLFIKDAHEKSLTEVSKLVWEKARESAVQASTGKKKPLSPDGASESSTDWKKCVKLAWVHWMSPIGFFLSNRFRIPILFYPDLIGSNAFVNNLGFSGAPPMISYKPSTLPTNSFGVSVTMGLSEPKPTVEGNAVVIGQVAPLFIRIDHRLVNGYQAAAFISTLRSFLQSPEQLLSSAEEPKSESPKPSDQLPAS